MDTERLRIPKPDLAEEAREIAEQSETLRQKVIKDVERVRSEQIPVSAVENGKIRRNGPCPCGSGRRFKKCCRDKTQSGELRRIKAFGKKVGNVPSAGYEPPKAVRRRMRQEIKAHLREVAEQQTPHEDPDDFENV